MYFLRLLLYFSILVSVKGANQNPRIAIIGGGMGGTTAAYELTQMTVQSSLEVDIDLYEPGNVGGRLATSVVNGFEFETGGSIIHNENKYMNLYAEKFNLGKMNKTDSGSDHCASISGFYDGNEFIYTDSDYFILSYLKLWWRYGRDLFLLLAKFVPPIIDKFKRIYELQSEGRTYNNVHGFLADLNSTFPDYLTISLQDMLVQLGYNDRVINEFVFLATNVNYNQNTSIHAFAGGVALAGSAANLWSVRGGNKQVPEQLLENSDAKLLKHSVQSISLTPDGRYSLEVNQKTVLYNYVIIACPVIENSNNKITFYNFPEPINIAIKYRRTIATLVSGVLNHRYFKYDSPKDLPNTIYSVNESLFFNSISVLEPVNPDETYNCNVFKVFSKDVLTKKQLDSLFLCHSNVKVIDWLAYPLYDTSGRNLSSVLHYNLFHTNSIEWAASAMEMSAIAGHNVALQVMNKLTKVMK